ncbi:hypothetical protein ABZ234_08540 [Nocardiopsis sp. NPDC006198]|uniref:hypothetical protein n=1 Tax=Nocardiopsis sp. NPDC006198 TaxID=3154472 RepID=UPI00339ED7BE
MTHHTTPPQSAPTVFDALRRAAAAEGQRLSHREYLVDEATARHAGNGQCWRLMAHPHVDSAPRAHRMWMRGRLQEALTLLHDREIVQAIRADLDASRGLASRTLWAPGAVLTHAERFCLHALRMLGTTGFDVRVLDHHSRVRLGCADPLPDLVVYPRLGLLYLRHHTPGGWPGGAVRLYHPALAAEAGDLLARLTDHAVGIEAFARPHG